MNLRKLIHIGAFTLLLGGLSSCITDDLGECPEGQGGAPKNYYYIHLNVISPSVIGTRSETRPGGDTGEILPGTSKENQLVSAHLYFTDEDYNILADFESDYVEPVKEDGTQSIRIQIKGLEDLNKLVGEKEKTVYVLIVGNKKLEDGKLLYTPESAETSLHTSTFKTTSWTIDSPLGNFGNDGKYLPLMSYEKYEVTINPQDESHSVLDIITALFNKETANNRWWMVNEDEPIRLERGVARIEFRGNITDNSEDSPAAITYKESFDYTVYGIEDLKVRLNSMTPFNIGTESYLFRHTASGDNSGASGNAAMFGVENGNTTNNDNSYNWIASPTWDKAPSLLSTFSIADNAYKINGGDIDAGTTTIKLSDLTKNTSELLSGDSNSGYKGGYHPWCYVSENTLKSVNDYEEAESKATGMAFRFVVLGSDDEPLIKGSDKLTSVMNWSTEEGKAGYLEITDPATGKWVQLAPVKEGDKDIYYLDYIALLKHNTKPENGPMYYGVVRNNTYQVSISKLLGLPNPQEPKTMYLELQINVLSWVKRDVEFEF